MKYKLSRYVKQFDYGNGKLIYSTFSNAKSFVYDKYILKQLETLTNGNKLDEEEIYPELRSLYCVEEHVCELSSVNFYRSKALFDSSILNLIMIPTADCNFSCIYCYETKRKGKMSIEILDKLYDAIVAYNKLHKLNELVITWFGGEPMLCYDEIIKFTKKINKFAEENDIHIRHTMTTNAYLLEKERFEEITDLKFVFFQITIDGGPESHNKQRPTRDGRGTWDKIVSNLKEMSKIDKNFKVTLRVNYNYDTLEGLEELLKFAEKNLDNNKFHFFFKPIGRYGGENDQNLDVIEVTEESYILEEILKLCSKYDISYASHFHETGCFNNLCYANYANNLVVLRDGTLTKCTSYTEADECELNVVGTIKDGIFNINNVVRQTNLQAFRQDKLQ
jgi:uncharacterized protein